jgi:hypothetical protein
MLIYNIILTDLNLDLRDNKYLQNLMYEVWEEYFSDVPRQNFVITKFGRHAKRQLGCIKYAKENTKVKSLIKEYKDEIDSQDIETISVILLTKYFQDEKIPEFVLISTLSHEICHYAHGFHSPLKQKYRYPHRGSVVKKEMLNRGLGTILKESEDWLKDNWINIIRDI